MDPISIVSTASTVAQIAWKVHGFINTVKNINSKVQQIQSDMKQIGDICELVKIKVNLLPPSHHDLLKAIDGQVNYCLTPVQEIEKKIESQRRSSNLFSRALRQAKFEFDKDEMDRYRSQIQSSLVNLQITLQLVNVQTTYLAPQRADDVLLSILGDIKQTLNKQGDKIGLDVRHCAGRYISSAITLYEESVRATSILGPQDKSEPSAVQGWLNHLASMRIDDAETESFTVIDPGPVSEDPISTAGVSFPVDGYESEDSLENEVASHALMLGRQAFLANEFDNAESLVSEFLECIKILPEHKRRTYDLEEVHLLLAICAFYLHDAKSAEAALVTAIGTETKFTKNAETKCDAVQCLVIVYLRTGRQDQAISTCEHLYKGQKRLFGKEERCHKTLALLARIHAICGNTARASAYRSMIPIESRDQLLKDAEEISLQQAPNSSIMPDDPSNESVTNPGPTASEHKYSGQHTEHSTPFIPHPTKRGDDYEDSNPLAFENRTFECPYYSGIAWSRDNKIIAFVHNLDGKITLRDAIGGKPFHSFGLDNNTVGVKIAFNSSATKLAAIFSTYSHENPDDVHLCMWSAISYKQLTRHNKFTRHQMYRKLDLVSFNSVNDDQLLLLNETGPSSWEAAIYSIETGTLVHRIELERGSSVGALWLEKDVIFLVDGRIFKSDMAMQTLENTTIKDILCIAVTHSHDLVVMSRKGKIDLYMIESGSVIPKEPCPPEAICDIWLARTLNLVAPHHSWTELGKVTSEHPWKVNFGFSPNGRYAYYGVPNDDSSIGTFHSVLVEEYLRFQD